MSDLRVLVVDDDHTFRMATRLIVDRAEGLSVVAEASDGEECLALAREHAPDAVLLDLLMPGMDGFETLPRLRSLLPEVTIVVLTALDEDEATREAALIGASAFLEKRHIGDRLVPLLLRQAPAVP